MRVLYLSYDGMTDPLGQSQVLPYLAGLAGRSHEITLISCEKPEHTAAKGWVRERCSDAGIDWHPLRYRKRPPILSTVMDLRAMRRAAEELQRSKGFDLVHCRSYLPAIVGDAMKREHGLPFLFDMRGFWVEERIEMGLWTLQNPLYALVFRYLKDAERRLFAHADAIVSLTDEARREMATWPGGESRVEGVRVIPCCVDFTHFDPRSDEARRRGRALLGIGPDVPVLVYLGSLGGNHLLPEMVDFFRQFRRVHAGARFVLITYHDRDEIVRQAESRGVSAEELIIRAASRAEVPSLVAAGDLGVGFKRASYSSKACSPTKFGEMLAMGLPVVANAGVGDTAEIIRDTGAGTIVDSFDDRSLTAALERVERAGLTPEDVRAGAMRWFNLDDGVERYDAIYRAIGLSGRQRKMAA